MSEVKSPEIDTQALRDSESEAHGSACAQAPANERVRLPQSAAGAAEGVVDELSELWHTAAWHSQPWACTLALALCSACTVLLACNAIRAQAASSACAAGACACALSKARKALAVFVRAVRTLRPGAHVLPGLVCITTVAIACSSVVQVALLGPQQPPMQASGAAGGSGTVVHTATLDDGCVPHGYTSDYIATSLLHPSCRQD